MDDAAKLYGAGDGGTSSPVLSRFGLLFARTITSEAEIEGELITQNAG